MNREDLRAAAEQLVRNWWDQRDVRDARWCIVTGWWLGWPLACVLTSLLLC